MVVDSILHHAHCRNHLRSCLSSKLRENHITEDDSAIDAVKLIPVLAQPTPDETDLDLLSPVDRAEVWFADSHVKVKLDCPLPEPHDMITTLPFLPDEFIDHDGLDCAVDKPMMGTHRSSCSIMTSPFIVP